MGARSLAATLCVVTAVAVERVLMGPASHVLEICSAAVAALAQWLLRSAADASPGWQLPGSVAPWTPATPSSAAGGATVAVGPSTPHGLAEALLASQSARLLLARCLLAAAALPLVLIALRALSDSAPTTARRSGGGGRQRVQPAAQLMKRAPSVAKLASSIHVDGAPLGANASADAIAPALPDLSLAARVEQLRAARRAAGGGTSAAYVSPFRHGTALVKVRFRNEATADYAGLAAAMPALVQAAVQQVGGGAEGLHPAPVVLSYMGFRGCWCGASQVAWPAPAPAADGAALAAAAEAQLPAGVCLVGAAASPLEGQAATAGAWVVEPAVLAASSGGGSQAVRATAALPRALLRRLEAAGCGLRVLVAGTEQASPFTDQTLRPGQPGWPSADGRLHLEVPADAGTLINVTLLAAAPTPAAAPGGARPHGADALLASLPLLALPTAAARAEACALWQAMLSRCHRQRQGLARPCSDDEEASAAAFCGEWAAFALDFALATRRGGGDAVQAAAAQRSLVAYLSVLGFDSCCELVARGGATAAPPQARPAGTLLRTRLSGDPPPPRVVRAPRIDSASIPPPAMRRPRACAALVAPPGRPLAAGATSDEECAPASPRALAPLAPTALAAPAARAARAALAAAPSRAPRARALTAAA